MAGMTDPLPPDSPAPADPTIDSDVRPSRTSAAIAARRATKSERLCREMVERLPDLDGPMLAALYVHVVSAIVDRASDRPGVRARLELPAESLSVLFQPPATT
jgi:hypothetical protein